MAETAWKPADQADPKRLCEGPGCMREFRPSKPGDRFCSERCESAAATVAGARGEPAAAAATLAPAPDTPAPAPDPVPEILDQVATKGPLDGGVVRPPSPPAPAPAKADPPTHDDGFRSGVREATELTFTLMRSQTFRELDSVVALQIIREVLT